MTRSARAFLVLAFMAAPALAQQPQQRPTGDSARAGGGDFNRLTQGATVIRGFFDFYQKPDRLYMLVPKDRLGSDFLMNYQIAQGIGANGLFGGTMLSIFESDVVALERRGDRLPHDEPRPLLVLVAEPFGRRQRSGDVWHRMGRNIS